MNITSQSSVETTYVDPETQEDVTETKTSNVASTTNLTTSITKEKTADKTTIKKGEELSQDNTITNGTELTLTSVTFVETLSEGASFVEGSVEINGESMPELNPVTGLTLTDMNPDDTALITYKIQVDSEASVQSITSTGALGYTANEQTYNENTNTLEFTVVENLVEVQIVADKMAVVKGETIHYTTNITNNGALDNKDLTFTCPIPDGTTFVEESVSIDETPDISLNPATGFALPNLSASGTIKVEFDVRVN